jgi:murein endopeptidase
MWRVGARFVWLSIGSSLACEATEVESAGPIVAGAAEHGPADARAIDAVREIVTAPRAELVGDPNAAEREIIATGEDEISDAVLLSLPGSHDVADGPGEARDRIREGGRSIGTPDAGSLEGGIQLPFDPGSYTRRDATRSYATTQTLQTIRSAFHRLRMEHGVRAEVVIGDISLPRGGAFAPHASHTSGRDIDVRLVLAAGVDRTTLPFAPEHVDWDATWALVHSFLVTGRVTYVFLDLAQQAHLRAAAARAGVHVRVLDRWFQFDPGGPENLDAIVRHEPGHRGHLHIRLSCEGQGLRCQGA